MSYPPFSTGVVPATYPASGPVPTHVDELATSPYTTQDLLGAPYVDLSWRWIHHDALLTDPNNKAHVDDYGTRFDTLSWNRELGGGDGPREPFISFPLGDTIIDPRTTPIFTIIVCFDSFFLIDNRGQPINLGPIPVNPANPHSPPSGGYIAPQPVLAYDYTTDGTVFELVIGGGITWISDGSNWVGIATPTLQLGLGTNGGAHPSSLVCTDPILSMGGAAIIGFDYVTNHVAFYVTPDFSPERTKEVGVIPFTPASSTKGFSAAQFAGGGNIGAYYWSFFTHLNGYISSMAVIGKSAAETVDLMAGRSRVQGTGAVQAKARFRAADAPSAPLPVDVPDSAYWWPMDDASPGPMKDVLAGAQLSVVAPSVATFRVDGGVEEAGHSKALRLGSPASYAPLSNTALSAPPSGPRALFGVGGLGNDFTFSMLLKWEGPTVRAPNDTPTLFVSSVVPVGFGQVPAILAEIGPAYAEPFGMTFSVWDATSHTYHSVVSHAFDWPAGYAILGNPLHATKVPVWTSLTCVYRTRADGSTTDQEAWVNGELVASGPAGIHGWGANVWLAQVGGGTLSGAVQHVKMWRYALDPAVIRDIAAAVPAFS